MIRELFTTHDFGVKIGKKHNQHRPLLMRSIIAAPTRCDFTVLIRKRISLPRQRVARSLHNRRCRENEF